MRCIPLIHTTPANDEKHEVRERGSRLEIRTVVYQFCNSSTPATKYIWNTLNHNLTLNLTSVEAAILPLCFLLESDKSVASTAGG